ncbi:MAG: hypothetical protein HW407_1208 [Bacteroidetes bacterium]|nr:hypothetical protein [Bacteroidota bacterium]
MGCGVDVVTVPAGNKSEKETANENVGGSYPLFGSLC